MRITIEKRIEIVDGKGYPLTITRITGLQEIYRNGMPVQVSMITYHDCRDGCTPAYRWAFPPGVQTGASGLPVPVEERLKELAAC